MNDAEIHIRHAKNLDPLKVGGKCFKSAYDWELAEKDLKRAANELGETEERQKECLRKLKKRLSNLTNINCRQDDFYVLRYLRVRKYDVSKAYQNVKNFYEQKKKHSEFFIIPPDLKTVQSINWTTWLPYADEEGRIIILLNFSRWNPNEKSFEEMIQTAANVADIVSMNPRCQINGVIAIYDLSGITARQFLEVLRNGRMWACLPLVQCVLLGSDMDELHQHINPALLPKRLNGSLDEEECDATHHILNNLPYIKYERSFGIS